MSRYVIIAEPEIITRNKLGTMEIVFLELDVIFRDIRQTNKRELIEY